jgi:hypothetical protein
MKSTKHTPTDYMVLTIGLLLSFGLLVGLAVLLNDSLSRATPALRFLGRSAIVAVSIAPSIPGMVRFIRKPPNHGQK